MKSHKVTIVALVYLIVIWMSCKGDETHHTSAVNTSGIELAKIQCGRCHIQPLPSSLSKHSWQNGVLPEMSYYLGMSSSGDKMFNMAEDEYYVLKECGLFPNRPLLSPTEWDSLKSYYIDNAPDSLSMVYDTHLDLPSKGITENILYNNTTQNNASVTLLKYDSISQHLLVFVDETKMLEEYDKKQNLVWQTHLNSAVSDIEIKGKAKYVLQMGNMNPNDRKQGKLSMVAENGQVIDLIDSLKRPVDLNLWDINRDGIDDYVICNFGNLSGHLSWYDGSTKHQHIISNSSGPRIAMIRDIDGDGEQELIALFCQGDEKISVFHKNGTEFTEEVIMRFPPNNGSSFLDLQDINKDGFLDILYTNGDNADLSIENKSYHGFTIFLNDGKNNFKQSYFYAYPGCSKVVTLDFDKDGELDFGLISYFPNQLKNGFIFLRPQEDSMYEASSIIGAEKGAWMVMDFDQKNNSIFIGSYNRNVKMKGKQVEVMKLKHKS